MISALIHDPDNFTIAKENIPDHSYFYDNRAKIIYHNILKLDEDKKTITSFNLKEQLRLTGDMDKIGGEEVYAEMLDTGIEVFDVVELIDIIRENYTQRMIVRNSQDIILRIGRKENLSEIVDQLFTNFTVASKEITADSNVVNMLDSLSLFKKNVAQKIIDGTYNQNLVKTGFEKIDSKIFGFPEGSFILIGARASVGKTSLAINLIKNIAEKKKNVLFFSLEQPQTQIISRFLSMTLQVSFQNVLYGDFSELHEKYPNEDIGKLINTAIENFSNYSDKIFTIDESNLTIKDIKNIARKYKNEYNIDAVFIDYIQFISPPISERGRMLESRLREMTIISRELKEMSRELNIPVVALSQLSRDVEKRPGKSNLPKLSDLRDSGTLEQDADIVILLSNEEKDDENTKQNVGDVVDMIVDIAKNRNGPTGRIKFKFIKKQFTFEEY